MFRYEWYKIWHNRRILLLFLALFVLNILYFRYYAETTEIPAQAYRKLSAELRRFSDVEAMERLSGMKEEVSSVMFGGVSTGKNEYPKFCDNLFRERELYALKEAEYSDAFTYPVFVEKAANAASEYRVILEMLGGSKKKLADVEHKSSQYASLRTLTLHNTHTRGIAEAVSLPSLLLFELFLAIFLVSFMFAKEKEQGLLRLYASMKAGRGRLFLTRVAAVSLSCFVMNLVLFLSTVCMGIALYGMPGGSFLTQPLQALAGYKQAVLRVNIGGFLLLVYLWSCLVSLAIVMVTAAVCAVVSSAMKVYVALFGFVGIEGILFLNIDELSYLSIWKRVNIVSFANPGYTIARYRNEFLFGKPIGYPLMAFGLLALVASLFGLMGFVFSEKGLGVSPVRGRGIRLFRRRSYSGERPAAGTHTSLVVHECAKFFRFEKIGYVILIPACMVLLMTKPYERYYTSVEEMFYQSYLYRLIQTEPEQYAETVSAFEEELAEEYLVVSDQSSLSQKESALGKVKQYALYLEGKEGARAVDSRGYERLYNNAKQNIILGVVAILAAILCGAAMMAAEYRTGMAGQLAISPERGRIYLTKALILLATISIFFVMIYGRYLYQILKGYGTAGITFQANSMMDFQHYSGQITIAGGIALLLLKRFVGMLFCAGIATVVTSRAKSFLVSAIICIAIMPVPLLLCLTGSDALRYVLLNWFFL